MSSDISAQFLQAILDGEQDVPIVVFWDRAPWHRGPAIQQVLAANPRLEILYFPAGSPELNPQEHVWKAARQAVSHNHSCLNLPALRQAFAHFLDTASFHFHWTDKFVPLNMCGA